MTNPTIAHPFQDDQQWQFLMENIAELAKKEVLARFEQVTAEEKQDGSLLTEAEKDSSFSGTALATICFSGRGVFSTRTRSCDEQ